MRKEKKITWKFLRWRDGEMRIGEPPKARIKWIPQLLTHSAVFDSAHPYSNLLILISQVSEHSSIIYKETSDMKA